MCYYPEAYDVYVRQIEAYQFSEGLTNNQMAEKLGISDSAYKRLKYGGSQNITLDIIMRMYELNGLMMWEMTGAAIPLDIEVANMYKRLPQDKQRFVRDMIQMMIDKDY